MPQGITIITPTGGRSEALALCHQYVLSQTFRPLQWIMVDDAGPAPGPLNAMLAPDIIFTVIHPEPFWQPGQNTLARNLLAAIPEIQYDRILIFEDDDYYPPHYAARMNQALDQAPLAGPWDSRYYHLPTRRHRTMWHPLRASLFHTGFRKEMLPKLDAACSFGSTQVDIDFWASANENQRWLAPMMAVGMKGLPGRPGIGIGHRPEGGEWVADRDLSTFKRWLGPAADLYQEFL